jgi:hypothetical protein
VIVAEDITSRFLNVISMFNGNIPLVAIQMKAFKLGDQLSLMFTTVLDEVRMGLDDEDELVEATDRAFWIKQSSNEVLALADQLLEMVKSFDPKFALKYNKFYIGLAKDGMPTNFVTFLPRRDWMLVAPRIEKSDEIQEKLKLSGLDTMSYDSREGRYRIRLTNEDLKTNEALLRELLKVAYHAWIT